MNLKKVCKKLNKLIPCHSQEDVDLLNKTFYEEFLKDNPDATFYWNREIYINCNFDDKKMKEELKYSGKVEFVPSDDPFEHNGIVATYKKEYKTGM